MHSQVITINAERKVTLTCYLQGTGEGFGHLEQRPAAFVIPGGGYVHCSEREADPVAFAFLKAGYQAFILRYTCQPDGSWPLPLQDYEAGMKILYQRSKEWKIDSAKIITIGFSAGGHLACAGGLLTSYRPAAMILGYSLLTNEIEKYAKGYPSLVEHVDDDTPPTFLFATANDASVSVQNTFAYASALVKHKILFECHVYPYGRHGFSTGEDGVQKDLDPLYPTVQNWVADSIAFCGMVFQQK